MPIDVNLEILTNLYKEQGIYPKTHILVLDLIKRMTTTPRQLCTKRCEFCDRIGNIDVRLFGISLGSHWEHMNPREIKELHLPCHTLVHFGSILHTPSSTSLFESLSNDHLNLENSRYMSHWKHVKGSKWFNEPKCSIMIFGNHF